MTTKPFNTAAAITADAQLLAGIKAQRTEDVQAALKAGASPDAVNEQGKPALLMALEMGHHIISYILLSAHANPILPDKKYDDGLMMTAVCHGMLPAFEALRAAGVGLTTQSNSNSLLYEAVHGGHSELAKRLLAAGVDVNELCVQGSALRGAMNALVLGDNEDCVQLLLDAGANPLAESYSHSYGYYVSDLEESKYRAPFIHQMVETAAKRFEFFTALDTRDIQKMNDMLGKGLSPDIRNTAGDTALIYAAREGFVEGVEMLLATGAKKDLTGQGGNTPLHVAAAGASIDVAQQLVAAGASAITRNNAKQTPLQFATQSPKTNPAVPAVLAVIQAQHEKEMQVIVKNALQPQPTVTIMKPLKIKPRG